MTFTTLSYEKSGPLLTLTIQREKALNALNPQVIEELLQAVARARTDEVRAVILTGAGDKAFVAGADIAAMVEMSSKEALRFAQKGHELMQAITELPMPVLAAVHGYALGGGLELALACDFIYASTKAKFGQPEVGIGVMPGFGGTQRLLRRIGPARAAELIFTGAQIDAVEALRMGLVNGVLPKEDLLTTVVQVATSIAQRAPLAVAASKRAIQRGQELPLSAGNEVERELFAGLFDTTDQKEGMRAFLSKRPPVFSGA